MAKGSGKMNGGNREFSVRGDKGGNSKGQKAPAISGGLRKGDSRSKSSMRPITPQKGL